MWKTAGLLIAALAVACSAQLVSSVKKDSVQVEEKKPLVLSADSLTPNIQALDDSIKTINAAPSLEETAKSMAIYKGLQMVGKSFKNSFSPNSAEVNAAERELDFK